MSHQKAAADAAPRKTMRYLMEVRSRAQGTSKTDSRLPKWRDELVEAQTHNRIRRETILNGAQEQS